MSTIFAFDFDGTLTPTPGSQSLIYSFGSNLAGLSLEHIYLQMAQIFETYIPEDIVEKYQQFFNQLYQYPNSCITVQTNNHKNVVLSCLKYHIGVPLDKINMRKSCFRECDNLKSTNINNLAKNTDTDLIYYFDDSNEEIARITNRTKVKIIQCEDGEDYLGNLLDEIPVTDQQSLSEFLEEFAY